jgi:hypothetical protein
MGHLFDKDMPTVRPTSVLAPFCSKNTPPSVSIPVSFGLPYTRS